VGNDAVLMLPAPGTAGSLSFNNNLIIETVVEQDIFGWIVIIGSGSVIGLSIIIYLVVRKKRRAKKKYNY
jgi:cellobiose-specific phosphotransferase system component IIC